jgi:peptidoglycan/xylan/chitin deacetylase (PgdA/CDA1 family)
MILSGLSVDVDSVASHLEGYGFEREADDGAAYRIAIPRALDIFESFHARATFFLIGEEAAAHPECVRDIVRRGHEVASHSMTHELPFANLSAARAEREIGDSRRMLTALADTEVVGFRAPSWDADPALLTRLAAAGYRYDASAYPSILLPLLRRAIAARADTGDVRTGSALWNAIAWTAATPSTRLPTRATACRCLPATTT